MAAFGTTDLDISESEKLCGQVRALDYNMTQSIRQLTNTVSRLQECVEVQASEIAKLRDEGGLQRAFLKKAEVSNLLGLSIDRFDRWATMVGLTAYRPTSGHPLYCRAEALELFRQSAT